MPQLADRNLLVGILAVQMDFVTHDQLIVAMQDWLLHKSQPLEELLAARGALRADAGQLLASLVDMHLKMHGGDPEMSLAALSSVENIRADLGKLPDVELQASLGHVSIARRRPDAEETDAFATLPVGQTTSEGVRFRILRPHARGGLGEVSVARDTELNREVALKQIQSKYADDPNSRARFTLEAQITGSLEHPGIVPVYGLGTYGDGRPFYAMRFIRGDSLKEGIFTFFRTFAPHFTADSADAAAMNPPKLPARAYRSLEFRKLLGRFVDVCNAVAYAHDRGVLHRDLKPGNIMLGKYGETLVVDWGLAKAQGASSTDRTPPGGELPLNPQSGSVDPTQFGTMVGTLQYMSPEQAEGRLDLMGPGTDVFALGATLYHLLTGRPPYGHLAPEQLVSEVQKANYISPRRVNRAIPRELEAVCLKAMEKNVDRRYSSAIELADAIERYLAADNSYAISILNMIIFVLNMIGVVGVAFFGVMVRPAYDRIFKDFEYQYGLLDSLLLETPSEIYLLVSVVVLFGLVLMERLLKRITLRLAINAAAFGYLCIAWCLIFVALTDPLFHLINSLS